MGRYSLVIAMLGLAACSDKAEDSGTFIDPGNPCTVEVSSTVPSADAADAYYRAEVEFHLSEADSTANLSLLDATGAAVDGSSWTSEDGTVVYFTPTDALAPVSSYTATLDMCQDKDDPKSPSIGFMTSSLGETVDCELTGRTYMVDLANARFVKPEGVAELLLGQLEDDILMGVTSESDTEVVILGALGSADGQDFCTPTIDFPVADYTGAPYFSVGPQDTAISAAGYDIEISSLMISGTFASDCSSFGGAVLAGELDARVLGVLLGELVGTEDPDEICTLLTGFGVTCGDCSSDGEAYCIEILADQMIAEEMDSTLECIAEEDCHESCETVGKECDVENYPECESETSESDDEATD
jgi:hypothetical protein